MNEKIEPEALEVSILHGSMFRLHQREFRWGNLDALMWHSIPITTRKKIGRLEVVSLILLTGSGLGNLEGSLRGEEYLMS
jgi:hypothetical protein